MRSLLLRDYIQRALYSGGSGYFNKEVVRRMEGALPFKTMLGEAEYRRALMEQYAQSNRSWLTPAEIFQPHYAGAIARSIISRHERLYPGEPLQLLEIGGGNGTCAEGVLECLREEHPELYESCHYRLLEISKPLAEVQHTRLSGRFESKRFEVVHADAVAWAEETEPLEGPWFILALEVRGRSLRILAILRRRNTAHDTRCRDASSTPLPPHH